MDQNLSQRGSTRRSRRQRGGEIAWAVRKNSPELKAELNAFFSKHSAVTSFGATIRKRYFSDKRVVKNALEENAARKFVAVIDLFRRYGAQYNFDYLMIVALAYQESELDQSRRGSVRGSGPDADQALDRSWQADRNHRSRTVTQTAMSTPDAHISDISPTLMSRMLRLIR